MEAVTWPEIIVPMVPTSASWPEEIVPVTPIGDMIVEIVCHTRRSGNAN
jgi:hypothetical protein